MRRLFAWRRAIAQAQIPVYAANAAFFLLLSLFPAMALLLSVLGRLSVSHQEFFPIFQQLIPQVLLPLFQEALANGSVPILSLSALTGLWSASRGIYGLLQGLRRICALPEHRNSILLRLLAIGYTVALLAALVLTFGLYSLGQQLLFALRASDAPIVRVLRFALRRRGGIAFAFLSALFLLIFRTFPPEHRSIRQALPGSLVTAGGWVLFSRLFSLWATDFAGYSRVYGSVAVVAMAMLWLYFCLSIVLFGALFNEKRIHT